MSYHFGTFGFLFIDDIAEPPFVLKDIGIEKRNSTSYFFDNRDRNITGYLFQYTLKGYGIYEANHQKHKVEPGQAFFVKIPNDEKYYMPVNTDGDGWQYLYLHFEGSSVEPYYQKIIQKTGKIINLSFDSNVVKYLFQLHEQLVNGIDLQPFEGSEAVFHFLALLCRNTVFNRNTYSASIQQALEIMEHQFAHLNGIEAIADTLHISHNHFTREFTRQTGTSPVKYLNTIRIQHALQLLRNTSLPIEAVATECGFSCGNYFAKSFKKYMNISPKQFRNQK